MSKRHKARLAALNLLFEGNLREISPIDLMTERGVGDISEGEYAQRLVKGVVDHLPTINSSIEGYAQGWDLDRLPAVDRNILRLAIYELLWATEVPEAVAIDEALNFARELSTEDSAKYVHGVLGKIAALKSQLI